MTVELETPQSAKRERKGAHVGHLRGPASAHSTSLGTAARFEYSAGGIPPAGAAAGGAVGVRGHARSGTGAGPCTNAVGGNHWSRATAADRADSHFASWSGHGRSGAEFDSGAEVWHLGVYRDEATATPVEYYSRFPGTKPVDVALVLDPMLATGGSAVAVLARRCANGACRM